MMIPDIVDDSLISGILIKRAYSFRCRLSLDGCEDLGYDKTNHARWYDADAGITANLNYDENRRN